MYNIRQTYRKLMQGMLWLVLACLFCGISLASADGVEDTMPAPPDALVYWQLTDIKQEVETQPSGGYSVHYETAGLDLDLDDGLLTESLLMDDDAGQGITLYLEKNGQTVLEHAYQWTPLPVYIESGVDYPIDIIGNAVSGNSAAPNSLLGAYVQGEIVSRVSAGGYTSHPSQGSFVLSTDGGVYTDGRLVVSFILRDVNDMFRDRIVFTYTMVDGVKPVPTPKPGFSATSLAEGAEVPPYYAPVEGQESLWQITTAPQEYRAYGSMSGGEPAFYPADETGEVVMNALPADVEADFNTHVRGFMAEEPAEVPEFYTSSETGDTYTFITRDGDVVERAYGRLDGSEPAFYPTDEVGLVSDSAEPVNPQDDYDNYIKGFGLADPPAEAPAFYTEIHESVYQIVGRGGDVVYRAYGRLNGAEPAFYPSTGTGEVDENAAPTTPEEDFVAHIKGFDPVEPESLPKFYSVVAENVYAVYDRDGSPVFRVYGVKDGAEPAYYPSDEDGAIEEDALPMDPQEDFTAYIAGFEPIDAPEVPEHYRDEAIEGLWSFKDKDGNTHYRVYGSLNREAPSYYPSDETGTVDHDALPIDPASELALLPSPANFTSATPAEVPAFYTVVEDKDALYAFTDLQRETVYRVFGSYGVQEPAYYEADDQGSPVSAEPIDPEVDYADHFGDFTPQVPENVPEYYSEVEGKEGLYSFTDKQYAPTYRIFGLQDSASADDTTNDNLPAFFPADEEGSILSGTPVDPEADKALMLPQSSGTVVTPVPSTAADTTPLVRSHESATPSPEPTELVTPQISATINPTSSPAASAETVTKAISAATSVATQAPTEAPTPVVTEAPTATPAPVVTEAPTPAVTEAPTATPTPVVTEAPTVTPTPVVTEAPTEAPTPVVTEAPTATPTPVVTEAPTATPTPVITEAPTEEPTAEVTEAPTPEVTEAPVETASGGLSTGAIVGIVVVAVVVIGGVVYLITRRKKE